MSLKLKIAGVSAVFFVISLFGFAQYVSDIPEEKAVAEIQELYKDKAEKIVPGYTFTATHLFLTRQLMDKRGGYTKNDLASGWLYDNAPSWDFGVLTVLRDNSISLRKDLSRSQSQSLESKNLAEGQTAISYDSDSWWLPATEDEYEKSYSFIMKYLVNISNNDLSDNANFFTRADNLSLWLDYASNRLGSLSQRLSSSVKEERVNTDLAGDAEGQQSTPTSDVVVVETPWLEVDNVYYEAEGATYAYLHLFRAIEHDFKEVLEKKNALPSVRQIIKELEAVQRDHTSPVILNGDGYGVFANYSLVSANYISRANAAIIDLKDLLDRG